MFMCDVLAMQFAFDKLLPFVKVLVKKFVEETQKMLVKIIFASVFILGWTCANPISSEESAETSNPQLDLLQMQLQLQLTLQKFQRSCVNTTGSDAGYWKFVSSLEDFQTCVVSKFDVAELSTVMQSLSPESRLEKMKKLCPALNATVPCFDGILEGIVMCTGESDIATAKNLMYDVIYGVLKVMCENEAVFMEEMIKPEFSICANRVAEQSEDCTVASLTQPGIKLNLDEKQCQDYVWSMKCFENKINDCGSAALGKFINAFMEPILKINNCNVNTEAEGAINDNEIKTSPQTAVSKAE
ncbi:uncharacterized protein LOC129744137 [Uranotaenia lowii]|uniref:uncharacterized protein LOC129744137 n=1 Tax=Uranotaenia lowii TaxID=190385 RepID=UPI00247A8F2B|nr:uncharacterized protein LOC129744137 [Uranotaenia lowii]